MFDFCIKVAEGLKSQARITFDFVMFTVLARCEIIFVNVYKSVHARSAEYSFYSYSFITAVGLAEDSAVVLSASILVSPLMVRVLVDTLMNLFKWSPILSSSTRIFF